MKFVIDTNILFSAIIRKSITRKVILSDVFDLYVPEYLFEEINKHKDLILRKAKISNRDFIALLTLFQKHTKIVKKEVYLDKTPVAEEVMKGIDITDSPFLALALTLNCPIWSNDGHFKQQILVKVYTTKGILELLRR
jgi:predicted nucleic acid-binding protein